MKKLLVLAFAAMLVVGVTQNYAQDTGEIEAKKEMLANEADSLEARRRAMRRIRQ